MRKTIINHYFPSIGTYFGDGGNRFVIENNYGKIDLSQDELNTLLEALIKHQALNYTPNHKIEKVVRRYIRRVEND